MVTRLQVMIVGMTAPSTQILVLGGPAGVGKTSVAFEVSATLRRARVAHALIDGDNLDASYPSPVDSGRPWLSLDNLASLWRSYRDVGQHRLIYVNTVSVLEVDGLRRAVDPEAEVTAVLLEAQPSAIADRLGARERGSELEEHLARSAQRSADLREQAPEWVTRLDTTGVPIEAVAEAVVGLTGWLRPGVMADEGLGRDTGRWV